VSDKVEDIVLIGGGGHSLSCIPILERVERVRIKGIVDVIEKVGDEVLGYKIVGTDEHLEQFVADNSRFLITLGQLYAPEKRVWLYKHIDELGGQFTKILAPSALVMKNVKVGKGTIVMNNAILNVKCYGWS
jgi:hypothetical protein